MTTPDTAGETTIDARTTGTAAGVLAAVFEDHATASAARDRLVAAGIAAEAITVVDQPAQPHESAEARSGTIWDNVRRAFTHHPHAHGYAEAVERGHGMLFVRAGARQAEAMHLLEEMHPMDIMARSQSWAEQGWNGMHRSQSGTPGAGSGEVPPMLFGDSRTPDHVRSTGLLNDDAPGQGIGAPLTNPMGVPVVRRPAGTALVQEYGVDAGALPGDDI